MNVQLKPLFEKELNRIDIDILEVALAEVDNEWRCNNVCSPYSRIYFVESGEANLYFGEKHIKMSAGNIYIIPAETVFSYSCEKSMRKIYFHFNILRYNNYDLLSGHNNCIILENRKPDIEAIIKSYNKEDVFAAVSVKNRLYSIVLDAIVKENIPLGKIEEYSKEIKTAIWVIEKEVSANLKAKDIAKKLYISESRLQKQFKREVGVAIGHYINDRLMVKAENILTHSNNSIKDISESLGFCDQFYFSRRFNERFGMSPSVYKKSKYI